MQPNPNNGIFVIALSRGGSDALTGDAETLDIKIYDMTGAILYSTICKGTTSRADLSALPSGMYHLQVTNRGEIFNQKIIIQN